MLLFSGISHPGYFVPLGVSLSDQSASFWNTTKELQMVLGEAQVTRRLSTHSILQV